MKSRNSSTSLRALAPGALALACLPLLWAQSSGVLTAVAPKKAVAKRGSAVEAKISVQLRNGYHVNSNTPNDEYLIPLRLTWESGPLKALEVVYPKAKQENYSFSAKPVSVFTGDFDITNRFSVAKTAPPGPGVLIGKLRYQACTDSTCLPPRSVEVRLPYEIQ